MRISIWQQFSSNHSSGFTVVGEFATRSEAENAANKIREILYRLKDWHTARRRDGRLVVEWRLG